MPQPPPQSRDPFVICQLSKDIGGNFKAYTPMLQINEQKLVGRGNIRTVFLHPHDDSKIIKIYLPEKTPEKTRKSRWYKTLLPTGVFDVNARDLREHAKARKKNEELAKFICPVHEIVETDKGRGLVCDLVTDDNGQTSMRLREHVLAFGLEPTRDQLDRLFELLARHHVLFRDANAQNIMVQERGGKKQLVIIEGLGESNFVPYASVSKTLNARKLERKKQRILATINAMIKETSPAD